MKRVLFLSFLILAGCSVNQVNTLGVNSYVAAVRDVNLLCRETKGN